MISEVKKIIGNHKDLEKAINQGLQYGYQLHTVLDTDTGYLVIFLCQTLDEKTMPK